MPAPEPQRTLCRETDLEDPALPASICFWLYSHPPINDRIILARTYDPWSRGAAPQFVT